MLADKIYDDIKNILADLGKDVSNITLKKNLADYTISFHKNAAIKIKLGKKNYLYIKTRYSDNLPEEFVFQTVKSMPDFSRIELHIENDLSKLSDVLNDIFEESKPMVETFGCCNEFRVCSDALKCIHPDPIFASGCMYRENLDKGKVFYGKNRNI